MLCPARWKRITVGQSKVLKNRLFRFRGATRYIILIFKSEVALGIWYSMNNGLYLYILTCTAVLIVFCCASIRVNACWYMGAKHPLYTLHRLLTLVDLVPKFVILRRKIKHNLTGKWWTVLPSWLSHTHEIGTDHPNLLLRSFYFYIIESHLLIHWKVINDKCQTCFL